MSVMLMTTSIGGITAPLSAAARAASAATVFYTIIDAPRPAKTGLLTEPEVSAAEDIVLAHVNFAYPARPDLKILDDLCLRLPAGKVTAIVGPSGSGKSTIVGLLERWYEIEAYESGDIVGIPFYYVHQSSSQPCICMGIRPNAILPYRACSGATAPSPSAGDP
jgi:ABC-type multidrug transport system fused ATPase/permease subunit